MNPADGVVECFACELRALRAVAGEPAFWKMARRCDVSKSALAAAVAGYDLPSERVTRAFVGVCGGDWTWWSRRLAQARAQMEAAADAPPPGPAAAVSTAGTTTSPGQSAPGSELVPLRPVPPPQTTVPAQPAIPGFLLPAVPAPPVQYSRRTAHRKRTLILAAIAALALVVGTWSTVSLSHRDRHGAAAGLGPSLSSYDQTIGPGCPNTAQAKVHQGDFAPDHKWTQTTAANWNVPGCSNLAVYSVPTASSQPDRWQDEYDWYFDNVPRTAECTFHIYIPDTPKATYTAAYDWTTGDTNYLDSTAFVIDQSAYRGKWFDEGPYVFATGQAMLMVNDARGDAPSATLTAAAVRLTCKPPA